jgi:hypothetical protein
MAVAQALLTARGYSPKSLPSKPISLANAVALPDLAWVDPLTQSDIPHAQYWLHAATGLQVDLHFHVGMDDLGMRLSPALVWAAAGRGTYEGVPHWTLPPELWLVLLCAHGAKHGWERLRWLADVAALLSLSPPLDWKQIMALARVGRCRRGLASALLLAADLLGAPLPSAVRAQMGRLSVAHGLARWFSRRLQRGTTATSPRTRVLMACALWDDTPAGLAWLWGRFTIPSAEDNAWLPTELHWLAPALRPLRLAWLYGRGQMDGPEK